MFNPKTMKAKRIAGFRSKNEFSWAFAFDGVELEYLYEPKLFQLSNGQYYLPDFYFPTSKCFAEIKSKANKEEIEKARLLSLESEINQVILLEGYPSFRRHFKVFINGKMITSIFIISKGYAFDSRKYDPIWRDAKETSIIATLIEDCASPVSDAKHFETGEFGEERFSNNEAWKKATTHLEKQGWHDYLKDYPDVHS